MKLYSLFELKNKKWVRLSKAAYPFKTARRVFNAYLLVGIMKGVDRRLKVVEDTESTKLELNGNAKLILCTNCNDILRLFYIKRTCLCGDSSGYLEANDSMWTRCAVIEGPCIPLGFANNSFAKALQNRPKEGNGQMFVAFVIPEHCDSIKKGG